MNKTENRKEKNMSTKKLQELKKNALKTSNKELSKVLLPRKRSTKGQISSNSLLLKIRYGM